MSAPGRVPAGWTRRRFLKVGGLAIVGAGGVAALVREALGPGPAGPIATAPAFALAGGATSKPASPSPSPSAPAGKRRQFQSRPDLTPPEVTIRTAAQRVAPGYIFFTPGNGAGADGPTIVDDAGELVWARAGSGRSVADFRPITYRGRPALIWWEGAVNGGIGAGDFVLVDDAYRELGRIEAGGGFTADLHEIQVTAEGTALFFADRGVAAPGSPTVPYQVMDCTIREVDLASGRLIWSWHSLDHVTTDESFATPPTTTQQIFDYVHLNSIDVDRDGSLLVSARNTSTIYKIDRTSGEIVWRLGGKRSDFSFGDGATFSWQHDARRQADGTLSLYDDSAAPGHSRALVLELDETRRTADRVRDFVHPTDLLSTSQGNTQVLPNGDVFVGWGSQPFFSEFGPDGTLLFDATFPASVQSYRDFRAPWVGRPADPPVAAVDSSPPAGLTVYASWNGATEVAAWDVLGGPDTDAIGLGGQAVATVGPSTSTSAGTAATTASAVLASATRTGFETAIAVPGRPTVVAVQARGVDGRVLGVSAPMVVPD